MRRNGSQKDLEVGQAFGPYQLLEKADALGVGSAFKVRNTEAGRIELLRVLPRELLKGSAAQRFAQEARILLNLSHPNIVQLYSAAEVDGRMVITTELPEGMTLNLILLAGPVDLKKGLAHLAGVLTGLGHVHANGIVHRCVAPAFVHILPGGAIKVSGFAFARGEWDPRLTSEHVVIGMAGYVSPEQVEDSNVDARSDLYSTAAILYEIVTGRRPFESRNYFELMMAHLNDAARAPKEIRPEVSEELNRIILKGLDKDPDRRFQTAAEFHNELQGVQDALACEAH
jgi:serine/threonine-protein kinase